MPPRGPRGLRSCAGCHLPLYAIWTAGTLREQAFAAGPILTIAFGLAYTAFSEWLNVFVRASWAYSDWMPIVSIAGLKIGLSPLLQWIVVPGAAFAIVRWVTTRHEGGRP